MASMIVASKWDSSRNSVRIPMSNRNKVGENVETMWATMARQQMLMICGRNCGNYGKNSHQPEIQLGISDWGERRKNKEEQKGANYIYNDI